MSAPESSSTFMPISSCRYTSSSPGGSSSSNGEKTYRPRSSSASLRSVTSENLTIMPALNGRAASIVSVRSSAASPLASPMKTRRPDANTASGASVSGSIATSPRIPCALRIRPTIANAWAVMLGLFVARRRGLGLKRRLFLCRALGKRNCGCLQLDAKPLLMTPLQHTGATKQRANRVARLGPDAKPVVGALFVDGETTLSLTGSVLADDLDELAVARALRIGDYDAVHWCLLPPYSAESNSYHRPSPWCGLVMLRAHRTAGVSGEHPVLQKSGCSTAFQTYQASVAFQPSHRLPEPSSSSSSASRGTDREDDSRR